MRKNAKFSFSTMHGCAVWVLCNSFLQYLDCTFVSCAQAAEPVVRKGPSPEQITAIKAAIANAQTLEEVQRLENALTSGHLPSELQKDVTAGSAQNGHKTDGSDPPSAMEEGWIPLTTYCMHVIITQHWASTHVETSFTNVLILEQLLPGTQPEFIHFNSRHSSTHLSNEGSFIISSSTQSIDITDGRHVVTTLGHDVFTTTVSRHRTWTNEHLKPFSGLEVYSWQKHVLYELNVVGTQFSALFTRNARTCCKCDVHFSFILHTW